MAEESNKSSEERRNSKERRQQTIERRRQTTERRQKVADTNSPGFVERRESVVDRRLGLDRRRGPGRRRSDERKAAEEGQMSDEQFEFVMAIDEYKRANSRPFPTWTEVLEVIGALGYRKVADPQPLAGAEPNDLEKEEPSPACA